MNGIVAKLTSPHAARAFRAAAILLCCVLSVTLIGAVHTRPPEAQRPVADENVTYDEPVLADFRIPTQQQMLTVPPAALASPLKARTAPGGDELLKDVQTIAGSIRTRFEKALAPPALDPSQLPVPLPKRAAPTARFAVRWMEVTAYCACPKCCGPRAQGITASGKPVTHNGGKFVAADRALPFNTRLVIPGYNDDQPVPVLDRGGAIKGDKLDVYFPSHQQAREWGRRKIAVRVLN